MGGVLCVGCVCGVSVGVLWQFQDLHMLLASNHMIWSSEDHSSLSLRLHDAEQELGSMSCLDYWLDNTMSSIDNIGLCYHRDGSMQGYEIIRTADLPSGSRGRRLGFSPEAVMSHAHSVSLGVDGLVC